MKKKLLIYLALFVVIMLAVGIDTITGGITEQMATGEQKIAQEALEKGIELGIGLAVMESISELQRTNMKGFDSDRVIKQARLEYEKMKAEAIRKGKEK